jgi:hypothetical protein
VSRDEREISYEEVRREHVDGVRVGAHWAYLFGVILGSLALMLVLIAVLDAS